MHNNNDLDIKCTYLVHQTYLFKKALFKIKTALLHLLQQLKIKPMKNELPNLPTSLSKAKKVCLKIFLLAFLPLSYSTTFTQSTNNFFGNQLLNIN